MNIPFTKLHFCAKMPDMEDLLIKVGLNESQAKVYLHLLGGSPSTPPLISKALKITRTNTYKVLDGLVEVGLVSKAEINKKLTYRAEDPAALSSLVAEERNKVIALEHSVKEALSDLRKQFKKNSAQGNVSLLKGRQNVITSYVQQASIGQPIFFIKSRVDNPVLGFNAMNQIRLLTRSRNQPRYGITHDAPDASKNPELDKRSNLIRTWIGTEDYTAPVEWTVSGDELNMVVFDSQPYVIQIKDSLVSDAFLQMWRLLDKSIRSRPEYKKLPRKAQRKL